MVSGDADLNVADALRGAIESACADGGRVAVDLDDATLVDSRTIGVLAAAAERLRADGGRLPIVCTEPNIRRLFATIGLEGEFEFARSREEALAGP